MPQRPLSHFDRIRQQRARRRKHEARGNSSQRGYDACWQKRRLLILSRDHYMCLECGKPVGKSGHVDHIVPRRDGGTEDEDNLQTLCHRCHSRKTQKGK